MAYRDWSLYPTIGKYKADLEDPISSPKILGGIHLGETIHSDRAQRACSSPECNPHPMAAQMNHILCSTDCANGSPLTSER